MSNHAALPSLVGILLLVGTVTAEPATSTFYSAYSKYPDYCSTPAMMQSRTIPPLPDDPRWGETRLLHVTTVIRHGARTPTEGAFACWDGYWENEATGVWNCSLTIDMALDPRASANDNDNDNNDVTTTLFEKRYDALMDQPDGLSNNLFGTCQTGQLLQQGYEQHVINGQILRDAYSYDSTTYDHDISMRLLDLNVQDHRPWDEPQVYLRSDDEQRTLLSGQILLRSLFAPELKAAAAAAANKQAKNNAPIRIPVHTADYDRDILSINERICPRLTELRHSFEASSVYRNFNHSKEAKELRKFMNKKLGSPVEIDILGCLMPTVCSDRPLPDAFDYEGTSDIFDRMVNFAYKRFNMHLLANNGEYAKLAMAPLWTEIMGNINPIIQERDRIPPGKMAIISGHDDTISPLMASLGIWNDTQWPAYASMLLIELHEIIDAAETDRSVFKSSFAFRLLLNGEVMTHKMKGCQDDYELCDITILTDLVSSFAKRDRHCQPKKSFMAALTGSGDGLSGFWISILMVLLGGTLGGAGVFYYLTGSLPLPCFQNRKYAGGYGSSESGMSIPRASYSDEPYQDDPDKNGATFLD